MGTTPEESLRLTGGTREQGPGIGGCARGLGDTPIPQPLSRAASVRTPGYADGAPRKHQDPARLEADLMRQIDDVLDAVINRDPAETVSPPKRPG
jgi:hypothetical protein